MSEKTMINSRIPGFYKLTPIERRRRICDASNITDNEGFDANSLTLGNASIMVENTIGTFALPLATAVNFKCNGKDVLIPMVIEEPSVVAAVSNMAQLTRKSGGFFAESDKSIMIGQIQIPNVIDYSKTISILEANKTDLLNRADRIHPKLKERGGGICEMFFRHLVYDEPNEPTQNIVVVHFTLDCVDAMGANMVNTIAEHLSPYIERLVGQPTTLRILSNYATERRSRSWCSIPVELLSPKNKSQTENSRAKNIEGLEVAKGIVEAYRFAYCDPWRAATHNKGVMNGIDAVVIATGNDWRAIEAGAHAWASRTGQYRSLTKWFLSNKRYTNWDELQAAKSINTDEEIERAMDESSCYLIGYIEVPLQIGTVGGCIKNHPQVSNNLKIMENPTAMQLSNYIAMVGLAQNLGALRALVTDGIQKGHMKMHARNLAFQAGAQNEEITQVVSQLSSEHVFTIDRAREVLGDIRKRKTKA